MKRLSIILVALLCVASINAQLLWKISGNGISKPSYIFGTEHVAPISIIQQTAGLTDALNSVDELYGELSLEDLTSPSTQQASMAAMMAPADSTLLAVFTADELAEINDYIAKNVGNPMMTAEMFNQFKPAMLSNVLTLTVASQVIPEFNPMAQLDHTILNAGAELGKPVKGLESLQSQLDVLFNTPISSQAADLLNQVRSDISLADMLTQMTHMYTSGDLDGLFRLMSDPAMGFDEANREALIDNRNRAWVDFLLGVLPTTSMLIVVGAGHLPGDNGVLNLLRKQGYDVQPAVQ